MLLWNIIRRVHMAIPTRQSSPSPAPSLINELLDQPIDQSVNRLIKSIPLFPRVGDALLDIHWYLSRVPPRRSRGAPQSHIRWFASRPRGRSFPSPTVPIRKVPAPPPAESPLSYKPGKLTATAGGRNFTVSEAGRTDHSPLGAIVASPFSAGYYFAVDPSATSPPPF